LRRRTLGEASPTQSRSSSSSSPPSDVDIGVDIGGDVATVALGLALVAAGHVF
jgi:hypothetical protein